MAAEHPAKESITEEEAIGALSDMVAEPDTTTAEKGACVYTAGSKTYCANNLTKAECDTLKGVWTKGGKCP